MKYFNSRFGTQICTYKFAQQLKTLNYDAILQKKQKELSGHYFFSVQFLNKITVLDNERVMHT